MSFYIARYGRVLQYGGKATEPPLDTSSLGFDNNFEDKERAFYFRDRLREQHPRIFLREQPKKEKTMSKKTMTQEDFREQMRQGVTAHLDEFWDNLRQLKPRDYVDAFLKAASYGFSRAPTEKELDDDQREEQRLKEQQRKQELIDRGIELEDE